MEGAWHFCLKEVPNDLAVEAFGILLKRAVYGDVEPAHILEIAQELETKRAMDRGGEYPWIDTAKPFAGSVDYENPSEGFRTWLSLERARLYRSVDSRTQEIMLIRNPAAWDWKIVDEQTVFVRPAAIPTGQLAPLPPARSQQGRNR